MDRNRPRQNPALSEFDLIAKLFAPMAGAGAFGLLDDAAILTPAPGRDLVLTKDALVEGVHFFADDAPASVARKALRVSLSDLAAKGATPRGFLLALGRGARQDDTWLTEFAAGLAADSAALTCPLLGGDTVRTEQAFFVVTAFGDVPSGRMVRRQGGAPGDALYVSGTIGDAALGLKLRLEPGAAWAIELSAEHRAFLLDRYLHPQPRMALASALLAHASAAMDISDGLVGDCDKLASRLGREVNVAEVPLSEAARAAITLDRSLLEVALTGGDDYEILAAVAPEHIASFEYSALRSEIPMVKIGALTSGDSGAVWRAGNGLPLEFAHRSYHHF